MIVEVVVTFITFSLLGFVKYPEKNSDKNTFLIKSPRFPELLLCSAFIMIFINIALFKVPFTYTGLFLTVSFLLIVLECIKYLSEFIRKSAAKNVN